MDRFNISSCNNEFGSSYQVVYNNDGQWVRYTDAASEIARLQAEIADLKRINENTNRITVHKPPPTPLESWPGHAWLQLHLEHERRQREIAQKENERSRREIVRLRAELEEARARLVCVHDAVKQNKSIDLIRVEVGYWLTCDKEIIDQAAREMDAARARVEELERELALRKNYADTVRKQSLEIRTLRDELERVNDR